jgi:hypothetical protein
MRTKVYLENERNIDEIQKKEGIFWSMYSQDENGIFYVLDGELDRGKMEGYSVTHFAYLKEGQSALGAPLVPTRIREKIA